MPVPRRCLICDHAALDDIERDVGAGEPELDVAERYGVTRAALSRHKTHSPMGHKAPAPPRRQMPQPPAGGQEPPEDAAASIKAMLDAGEPTRRVYDAAARLAAGFLAVGLGPDQQRAWTTLRQLLRQASAAEGETIDRHADFPGLVEDLVTAVLDALGPTAPEGIEGRIADRLEELQAVRAEAGAKRRAAA